MSLINRYETIAGCRLDTGDGNQGEALDLMPLRSGATLWVRQKDEKAVAIELSVEDVWALREGCTRLLIDQGYERYIQVAVST